MKIPFNKNRDKKVLFSDESLKVKRVSVTISKIPTNGRYKVQKNASSPTGIKDQALADHVSFNHALAADGGRNNAESGDAYSAFYSCGSCSSSTEEKSDDTSQSGEMLMKRWRDVGKIISLKIEEIHDSFDTQFQKVFLDDFGQSAMMSIAKNRVEMDEMMMNATEMKYSAFDISPGCPMPSDYEKHNNNNDNTQYLHEGNNDTTRKTEASSSSSVLQLLQSKTTSTSTPLDRITACSGGGNSFVCDSAYQSTMVTCTDMGGCNKVTDDENDDIIILVQLPSDS